VRGEGGKGVGGIREEKRAKILDHITIPDGRASGPDERANPTQISGGQVKEKKKTSRLRLGKVLNRTG